MKRDFNIHFFLISKTLFNKSLMLTLNALYFFVFTFYRNWLIDFFE